MVFDNECIVSFRAKRLWPAQFYVLRARPVRCAMAMFEFESARLLRVTAGCFRFELDVHLSICDWMMSDWIVRRVLSRCRMPVRALRKPIEQLYDALSLAPTTCKPSCTTGLRLVMIAQLQLLDDS